MKAGYITNNENIHICGYDRDYVLYQFNGGNQLKAKLQIWNGILYFYHKGEEQITINW
jgi:hypothetical protein